MTINRKEQDAADVNQSQQTDSGTHVPIRVLLFVMLLAAFWGGNTVAIKIGLSGFPPFAAAAVRFSIALPLIGLWAAIRRVRLLPSRREIPALALLGVVFTVQIALINVGTDLTLAGRATVFLNAYPVYVAGWSHLLVPDDRMTVRKAVGLVVAFGGVLAVFGYSFFENQGATILGDALCIASGILLSLLVVMINRIAQNTHPLRLLTGEMTVGVPSFFLLSLLFEQGIPWEASAPVVGALSYQGVVVATFCFISWATILKYYPPSKVSVIFFTTPLWGVLLSFLILGEPVSASLIVGAALVAAGIFLVNRTPGSRPAPGRDGPPA
jgi:drug/metabolite transporter (DMT)-like permease